MICQGADQVVVLIAEGAKLPGAVRQKIGRGVVVHVEGVFGKVHESSDLTDADGGAASFNADIIRAHGLANDGEAAAPEKVLVPFGRLKAKAVSDLKATGIQELLVGEALGGAFGHAAPPDLDGVYLFGKGPELYDGLVVAALGENVQLAAPFGGGDAGKGRKVLDVLIGEPQGGQDLDVHEPAAVHVIVQGVLHVGGGGAKAGKKGDGKGDEDEDGQEAAAGVLYLSYEILVDSSQSLPPFAKCSGSDVI